MKTGSLEARKTHPAKMNGTIEPGIPLASEQDGNKFSFHDNVK